MASKSYVEIYVPLDPKEIWHSALKKYLSDVDVIWQNAYYHITLAFVDDTPDDLNKIIDMLKQRLTGLHAPVLIFDSINAFTTPSGMHFITLTSSDVPESFVNTIKTIRQDILDSGGRLESEFRLHVTLGRVKGNSISLDNLQTRLKEFEFSPIERTLTKVDFRRFRGEVILETTLPV